MTRRLQSRWAPAVVFLLTAGFVAGVWGSLREPSFIHDEAAYRLQAEIFSSFRLSAEPPPLPEFFEQYHVLLTPRLAPKYPPGHALLLVPGVWLGRPGLVPVLLHGLAAALLFSTARRLAGPWVGLLAWLLWLSAPLLNLWRTTYLSQSTSTAVWMLSAWLLLRWWEEGRPRDLVAIGVLVAWMGITRPLTAVAFAIPIGLLVLVETRRRRAWGAFAAAAASGLLALALLPAWAAASTGDWTNLPYTHWSRVYSPCQKLGFGADPTPPLRELPPDMRVYDLGFRQTHGAHTVAGLPGTLLRRLAGAGREAWGGTAWRAVLVAFFALGLVALDRRGWFAVAWAASPFLVYLAYAHPPHWAAYYHETQTILAFVTALGIWRALATIVSASWRPRDLDSRRLELPGAAVAALVFSLGLADVAATIEQVRPRYAYPRAFARALADVPDPRAIVFVRYHPRHNPHLSLIENPADFARARIWVARDREADNLRLIAVAPDRAPYLFDEASWTLYRLQKR